MFCREDVIHQEHRGFYATALLGALLFGFIWLGNAVKAPEAIPNRTGGCFSILTIEGDVDHAGTFLLEGAMRNGRCSLPSETIFTKILGLNIGGKCSSAVNCPDGWVPLEQKIVVTKSATNTITLEQKPLDGPVKLAWGMPLDLNGATVDDLCLVPFMKRTQAEAVVSRRQERPWRHLSELLTIKGIGPKTIEKWEKYLVAQTPAPSRESCSSRVP